MNVSVIEMDPLEAAAKFQEYRNTVKSEFKKTDLLMARTYKALKEGKRLIDLHAALKIGGIDEKGRPRFGFARADASSCRWDSWSHNKRNSWASFIANNGTRFDLPTDFFGWKGFNVRADAKVPFIPPALRPADNLSQYHILWEADWTDVPADPILLKHIAGNFYACVAEWDLTDLERAVVRTAGVRARQ